MDPIALDMLRSRGVDASRHVARQLYNRLIEKADLILAMEQAHVSTIKQQSPHANGRTFLLDHWRQQQDIPDPFRQPRPVHEHCCSMIEAAVKAWLPHL